jgi:hypothetical protein
VAVAIALLTVDAHTGGLPGHMEALLVAAVLTALLSYLARTAINAGRNAAAIHGALGDQEAH